MIKLEVGEYCNDCLDFTADVEKTRFTGDDFFGEEVTSFCETVIRCKNRNRCRALLRYLERKNEV